MPDNRKSYNAVIREFNRKHGLTQAQARVAWRTLRDRLDKTPRVGDLKARPRITAQVVKKAPAQERGQRAARTRAARAAAAPPAPPAPKMVIPPERFRQIEADWAEFEDRGWQDDPDESS